MSRIVDKKLIFGNNMKATFTVTWPAAYDPSSKALALRIYPYKGASVLWKVSDSDASLSNSGQVTTVNVVPTTAGEQSGGGQYSATVPGRDTHYHYALEIGTAGNPDYRLQGAWHVELEGETQHAGVNDSTVTFDDGIIVTLSGGDTLPVADTTAIAKDPVDATKLVRIDVGGVPTGTTAVVTITGDVTPLDKNLFDANTILKADTDNTPAALTMATSTILARLASGNIVAATVAQTRTLLALQFQHLTADTLANLSAKVSDATVASTAGTETYINKTIDPSANTIDGDKLDVTFTPSNYTPDAAPPEADDVDDLAAHLKGIDTALASGGGLSNIVEDTTPQLGGNMDVNGNQIVSVSNGNIVLLPNGTGSIGLGVASPSGSKVEINAATATEHALVLKTTDADPTKNLIECRYSDDSVTMFVDEFGRVNSNNFVLDLVTDFFISLGGSTMRFFASHPSQRVMDMKSTGVIVNPNNAAGFDFAVNGDVNNSVFLVDVGAENVVLSAGTLLSIGAGLTPQGPLDILSDNAGEPIISVKQAATPSANIISIKDNSDVDVLVLDSVGFLGIGIVPTVGLTMGDDMLIAYDVNAGITASTSQSQGNGVLTAQINEISVVANPNDTVTLPTAVAGISIEIINNGANTLQVFPASGDDLGLGVNLPEELQANETVRFVAFGVTSWQHEFSTEIVHAEVHDQDNTDAYVINDAGGDTHSYHANGLVGGDLQDWTFDAGGAGTSFPIASIADGADSGVDIAVTTTGTHGLAVDDIISQTNLADAAYVGIFKVKAIVSTTIYEVAAVFTATGTGTVDQAATLAPNAIAAGAHFLYYTISATSSTNNQTFDFQLCLDAVSITGTKIRQKFGTAADYGSMSGGGVIELTAGEKISLSINNDSSAGNITLRNYTLVLIRL